MANPTATFMYAPYSWTPPPPPVPLAEPPLHRTAPPPPPPTQQKKGGFLSSLGSSLTQAAHDIERGISKIDRDTHVALVDSQWRGKFALPPSEPLVGDWFCRSFDSSGVSFNARVLLYGQHLCASLTAPDGRVAVIVIPLTHIVTWERAFAQPLPPSAPANQLPNIIPLATMMQQPGGAMQMPNAVKLFTADSALHMLYGFSGTTEAATKFIRTFDPTWRAAFPHPPAYGFPPQGSPSVYQPR